MKGMRLLFSLIAGGAAGAGIYLGIGNSGLVYEGGLTGGLYSSLVIYPAALLVFAFVFWIVYAAMDPGSDQ